MPSAPDPRAAPNVLAGWLGLDIPTLPPKAMHRRPYRKTAGKRRRGEHAAKAPAPAAQLKLL